MSVRILAIDPGSNCGYSVMDVTHPVPPGLMAQRVQSGIWDLHEKRGEGKNMRYTRFKKFITELNPDAIAYELVNFPHKSTCAAEVYWGIVTVMKLYETENKISLFTIGTGDLKKRAVGKAGGKGTDKPAIVAAANKFFKIDPLLNEVDSSSNIDNNIADAMWLMQIALEEYAPVLKKKEG